MSIPTKRIIERLAAVEPAGWEGHKQGAVTVLVHAMFRGDRLTLEAAVDPLRDVIAEHPEDRGLRVLLAAIGEALSLIPTDEERDLAVGDIGSRFLAALMPYPRSVENAALLEVLDADPSAVSRAGRQLLALGLVVQRRVGRRAWWELTPRGTLWAEGHRECRICIRARRS